MALVPYKKPSKNADMTEFFHFKTISEVHRLMGLGKPQHPLITIIRQWPDTGLNFKNVKLTSDLYLLAMKGKINGSFKYGRNSYDYDEGTLTFIAPQQAVIFGQEKPADDDSGWTIIFHPDLIRKSELGATIYGYSFWNYDTHEALHVSDKEKRMLADLVERIAIELQQNIDKHSQELIISNLEMIMKYSRRYYDRQFYTRANLHSDFVTQFEQYLESYFSSSDLIEKGLPTVTQCGEALNMSGSYLSDLLKLETGKSAKAHIHSTVIDRAKTILLSSNDPISTVAYDLGFEYPQHFSKLFKSKTGTSPSKYRSLN